MGGSDITNRPGTAVTHTPQQMSTSSYQARPDTAAFQGRTNGTFGGTQPFVPAAGGQMTANNPYARQTTTNSASSHPKFNQIQQESRQAWDPEISAARAELRRRKELSKQEAQNQSHHRQNNEKISQEIQQVNAQEKQWKKEGQTHLKHSLRNQQLENSHRAVDEKLQERAAFNNARGLQFECYQRDHIIRDEKLKNTQNVKKQQEFDRERAQRELAERRAAPSGLITTEIRDQIEGQIRAEAGLKKEFQAGVASVGAQLLNERKQYENQERQTKIAEENQSIEAAHASLQAEQQQRALQKNAFRSEAVSSINQIEKQKKDAWNAHHKNSANWQETQRLQAEINQHSKSEKEYKRESQLVQRSHLDAQKHDQYYQKQNERQEDLRRDYASNGIQFECYQRDQIIQNERKNNTDYLVHQQRFDREKTQKDEAVRKEAPSGIVMTTEFQQEQMRERQQKAEEKHYLRAQQMGQYTEAMSTKQYERQNELQEAKRVADDIAARTQERIQEEAARALAEKNSYAEYLKTQMMIDRA